jgi:Spy/CpxP family protein refolding chaperone
MNLTQFFIAGSLAASLALPVAVSAQQAPQPPAGASQQAPNPFQKGQGMQQTTPSAYQIQRQIGRQMQDLNVTTAQQSQITTLINTYSQAHPEGSPRDRASMKQLREEILSVLTPQQQAQYEQERAALATQRAQKHQQQVQQQTQGQYQAPQGQAPQGQPQGQPPAQPQGQPPRA